MFEQIGFIGLGLIGGSLAKAIKKYNLAKSIVAYNRDETVLEEAYLEGVIDQRAYKIDENFSECDLIFLCCPVQVNIDAYKKLTTIVNNQCIITDVGSTKKDIMDAVANTSTQKTFIGGHPMAGSEKTRYSASNPNLFENAYYIFTPFENADTIKVQKLYQLAKDIKALPIIIDSDKHDFVTAAISHVPHVMASSLVNVVSELDTKESFMHTLAAGGFKDITRIASSSPTMWQQICSTNQVYILEVLEYLKKDIDKIMNSIRENSSHEIYDFFERARNYRNSFQEKAPGSLLMSYQITVDVEDKPGIIAQIATLLSLKNISIKNIGIINNREYTSGVLEIVFYDEQSLIDSIDILTRMNYTVYKR